MNVDEAETKLNTRPMVKERAEAAAAAAAARVAMLELESASESESEVESGLRRVGNVPTKQVVAAAAGGGTAAAAILQSVQLSSGSSVAPSCLAESYVPRTAHFAALLLCFFGFDLLFTAMRRVCAMAGGKVRRCSEPAFRLLLPHSSIEPEATPNQNLCTIMAYTSGQDACALGCVCFRVCVCVSE